MIAPRVNAFRPEYYATYQIEVCTVIQAGTDAETTEIFFAVAIRPSLTKKRFIALAGQEKRMLAIGLSAMVSGMRVKAEIDYPPRLK